MSRDAGTSRQTAVGASPIMNSVQCNAIQYKLLMMCLMGTCMWKKQYKEWDNMLLITSSK